MDEKLRDYSRERAEKCLSDYIEIYKDICSLEGENLISFEKENGETKKEKLLGLESKYKFLLNILKEKRIDISEYPKSLEDSVKQ